MDKRLPKILNSYFSRHLTFDIDTHMIRHCILVRELSHSVQQARTRVIKDLNK